MSRFEGVFERSRVLPAVTVAASIFLFMLVVRVFTSAAYFGVMLLQGSAYQAQFLGGFLSPASVLLELAFCVGVFAWLWLFAPVSAGLRLSIVIARSLLAVVSGTVVTLVVAFCMQMQSWLSGADFFSNSLSQATESFFRDGGNAVLFAITSTVQLAVDGLPVTVLAVVLTWSWLARHPALRADIAAPVEV